MTSRTELFAYLAAAIGTVVGLYVLQQWYGSYLDVSYHEGFANIPANSELAALRAEEAQKRSSLAEAKQAIATRGRLASPKIAPQPSEDLSAMSGWIRRPGFAPYTPRVVEAPVPTEPEVPVDGAPVDGAEAPAPGEAPPGADEGAAPAEAAAPTGAAAPTPPTAAPAAAAPAAPADAPAANGAALRTYKEAVTVEAAGQVPAAGGRVPIQGRAPKPGLPAKPAPAAQQ